MLNVNFFEKIDYLYEEIKKIEENTKALPFYDDKVTQELLNVSNLYEELKEILCPVLQNFKKLFRTRHSDKIKKVFFVALCEMIKQDFHRGMLLTFRNVTGLSNINMNHYYELLNIVTESQGLVIEKIGGRRQFEKAYISETGIPRNMTHNVIKMFRIYWRYFHQIDRDIRLGLFFDYMTGCEFEEEYILDSKDALLFEKYREEFFPYSGKVFSVFEKLDDIYTLFDNWHEIDVVDKSFIKEANDILGYDITTVLRNSDIQNIYSNYLRVLTITKFKKILKNLPAYEFIRLPNGLMKKISDVKGSIVCGVYEIRGNKYEVVIDPTISLEELLGFTCEEVHRIAVDYYCYLSREYFDIEVDGMYVSPREMFYKGQNRFVWMGKIDEASRVNVDGNEIVSSKKIKFTSQLIKCYDKNSNNSRLQYWIKSIKVNDKRTPYGKLTYSLNGKDEKLICVGNHSGVYYCENIRVEIDKTDISVLEIKINDEVIEKNIIEFEEIYLFDKWNGRRYYPERNNDKHSGSFICFTMKELCLSNTDYRVVNEYKSNGYNVVEFDVPSDLMNLCILGDTYSFNNSKSPYFFIQSDVGDTEIVDNIESIIIKTINLVEDGNYRMEITNDNGRNKVYVNNGEYLINDIVNPEQRSCCGTWICALWEKQRKIAEEAFVVIPHITLRQVDICTLEGKPIRYYVESSEECFASEVGEYCNNIKIDAGVAELEILGDSIVPVSKNVSIFVDKWNIVKEYKVYPSVWGVRVRNESDKFWSKQEMINIVPDRPEDTRCAIFSTGVSEITLQDSTIHIKNGINFIDWVKYFNQFKRSNEIIFCDGVNWFKQIFSCLPNFLVWDLEIARTAILTLRYSGPVQEAFTVRYFVNGVLEKSFIRNATKNNFLLHVLFGEAKYLWDKVVSVEILTGISTLPLQVFKDKIRRPVGSVTDALDDDFKGSECATENIAAHYSIHDFTDLDKLSEFLFRKQKECVEFEEDISCLVKKYMR